MREFIEDVVGTIAIFVGGVLLLFLLATAQPAQAQRVVRNGNTFKYETTRSVKDTLLTTLAFEDSKGNKYPIIVTRAS